VGGHLSLGKFFLYIALLMTFMISVHMAPVHVSDILSSASSISDGPERTILPRLRSAAIAGGVFFGFISYRIAAEGPS